MAEFITGKTLLERLKAKGIRITRMTLWSYSKKGLFKPRRYLKYGEASYPLYAEEDVDILKELIIERFKRRDTKCKSIFINGVPKSLQTYKR